MDSPTFFHFLQDAALLLCTNMESTDRVIDPPTTKEAAKASEWCFDTQCFNLAKLRNHHGPHDKAGTPLTTPEPSSSTRSIDIACEHCRSTFTQQPWTFLNDDNAHDFKAYLWIRIDMREAFLKALEDSRAEALRLKLTELTKDRDEFANYGPKRRLLVSLEGWRDKWKASRSGADGRKCGKPGQPGQRATTWARRNLPTNKGGVRPSTAPREPLTVATDPQPNGELGASSGTAAHSTSPDEQDFGNHYNVGFMFFKRKEKTSPYLGVTKEIHSNNLKHEFPNQRMPIKDILSTDEEKKKKNPLTEKPSRDTLRYFHFPANNMSWIEVSILFSPLKYGTDL